MPKTHDHDEDTKRALLKAVDNGEPVERVAKAMGVPRTTAYNWKAERTKRGAVAPLVFDSNEESQRLRDENKRLADENKRLRGENSTLVQAVPIAPHSGRTSGESGERRAWAWASDRPREQ